ncbi:MAG: GNAT family N-acetyltransferase [Clostridiales bacterium]|nr:GNAT family N-acetyltransferase [Clostridiales bacterium]
MKTELRKWRLEDAADVAEALNNRNVQDNLRDGIPFPYTEMDAIDYISMTLAADKDSLFAFAISAEGKTVGSIAVSRLENVHRLTAELGYYIAEPYWNRGITTEAVREICRYVFAHTDIVRIFAEPYAYNTASCRVLEKAGFQLEGVLRQNAVKNGRILDMKMYSFVKGL